MKLITRHFHETAGIVYHGGAFSYALGAYVLGWYGLFTDNFLVNLIAVIFLAHGMIIGAYLIHECGHNTIFRRNKANAIVGRFLNWMCGSCYGTFEDIRYKHFRHHMDNDDSVWFVYGDFFEKQPWLARITEWLEWAYVPAHEFLMHGIMMFSAFIIPQRRNQRLRQSIVILIRFSIFISVAVLWPKVAIGYVIAYILMMHVLRFMDALQHDYDSNPILFDESAPSRFGGRETEQQHTFSNPLSFKYNWPNWLVLNFGFHNAHHKRPTVPWYGLPAYYKENISDNPGSVIPFIQQIRMYHYHRVFRVLHTGGPYDEVQDVTREAYLEAGRRGFLYGGNAASFLISF